MQTWFMTQTLSISPDTNAPEALPALTPDSVAQLTRLTRDYARLSQGQAGLSILLGGVVLLLVALVEMAGHGWHFTWIGALSPLPLSVALAVTLLPFLWLGARRALSHWATKRFGLVEPEQAPLSPAKARKARLQAVMGRFVIPGLMLLGLVPIFLEPLPARYLRADLLIALVLVLHLTFPRLKGRADRIVALLLFMAPAFLLSGIQMAAGDTLLAYPLIGTIAVVMGLREHLAFRRVSQELATFRGLA